MKLLKNCISEQVSIDKKSLENILSKFETVEVEKRDYFLRSGSVCRKMAFIETGYLRMYDIAEGKEITFWIGSKIWHILQIELFSSK